MSGVLISKKYRAMNAELHESEGYGSGGWQWVGPVLWYMKQDVCHDLLDYGCGKGTLLRWFPDLWPARGYDPAVEAYKDLPKPADFVSCLDVLEHIEPAYVENVLDHLRSLTRRGGLFVISLREANKTLPDGRNAHLMLPGRKWWRAELKKRWSLVEEIDDLTKAAMVVHVGV